MNYPPILLSITIFAVLLCMFCSMADKGLVVLFCLLWVSSYSIAMMCNVFYEEKLKSSKLTVPKKGTTKLIFKSVIS